eukprot:m.9108 g.9108  ORF g.9108 m.9108 type:complete len:55 (+) comp6844_c0_seq1:168-332(+)
MPGTGPSWCSALVKTSSVHSTQQFVYFATCATQQSTHPCAQHFASDALVWKLLF